MEEDGVVAWKTTFFYEQGVFDLPFESTSFFRFERGPAV